MLAEHKAARIAAVEDAARVAAEEALATALRVEEEAKQRVEDGEGEDVACWALVFVGEDDE